MNKAPNHDSFNEPQLIPDFKEKMSVRETGAVYTPRPIAKALSQYAMHKVSHLEPTILEPSVGDGSFLDVIFQMNESAKLTAIDIDATVIDFLSDKFCRSERNNLNLLTRDFVEYSNKNYEQKYDLIIGNPPFIRRHNFSANFKQELNTLSNRAKYEIKHLKNAWAVFVVAAQQHLSKSGVLALVVPYELLTVNYGIQLQKEVLTQFERVDIFIPDSKAFSGIDQDAVVLVAQIRSSEKKGIFMHRVETLEKLKPIKSQAIPTSNDADWALSQNRVLLSQEAIELITKIRSSYPKIGDYCTTRPGIVTAANDYFILNQSTLEKLRLEKWANPILKKGSYLSESPIFKQSDFQGLVAKDEPTFFLHFNGDEQKELPTELTSYLEEGKRQKIHERYKCRNRKRWYEVPLVNSTGAFFFKRSHKYPRICINEADVLVTDTAYCITSNTGFNVKDICLSFYNSMTLLFAEIDGRFYGGGVLEITPKEFRGLPISYHKTTRSEFERFDELFSEDNDIENVLNFGDKILSRDTSISDHEIGVLRDAWNTIRLHRLRHSTKQSS